MARTPPQILLVWLDALVGLLARTGVRPDLIRFGVVGTGGLLVDTATVYALRHPLGLYAAGAVAFFIAATVNWAINRLWTFRHRHHAAAHRQWLKFLAANSLGFMVNRGLFFLLIATSPFCHNQPILPIAAGSIAGLVFNFSLSSKYVFS